MWVKVVKSKWSMYGGQFVCVLRVLIRPSTPIRSCVRPCFHSTETREEKVELFAYRAMWDGEVSVLCRALPLLPNLPQPAKHRVTQWCTVSQYTFKIITCYHWDPHALVMTPAEQHMSYNKNAAALVLAHSWNVDSSLEGKIVMICVLVFQANILPEICWFSLFYVKLKWSSWVII